MFYSKKISIFKCGMTSKNFQANHQSQWLNTKAIGAEGLVIWLLESSVKALASPTKLSTITIEVVSSIIGPSTPIDKVTSLVTGLLAHVMVKRL